MVEAGSLVAIITMAIVLLVALGIIGYVIKMLVDGKIASTASMSASQEDGQPYEHKTETAEAAQHVLELPPCDHPHVTPTLPHRNANNTRDAPVTYEMVGPFERNIDSITRSNQAISSAEYAEVIRG